MASYFVHPEVHLQRPPVCASRNLARKLILTHAKRFEKGLREIERRLDVLKIDWLPEDSKELPAPLSKRFLQMVEDL